MPNPGSIAKGVVIMATAIVVMVIAVGAVVAVDVTEVAAGAACSNRSLGPGLGQVAITML